MSSNRRANQSPKATARSIAGKTGAAGIARGARRRTYHHGDLKNVLVSTALTVAAEQGAQALSLREVARRAGVSHAASYRHFRDKQELLAEIATQGFVRLIEWMRAAVAQADSASPLSPLQAIGIAYVDFGVRHPEHLSVMFSNLIVDQSKYPALLQAAVQAYDELRERVRAGQREGAVRAGDERMVTLTAWALVHGLTLLIVNGALRDEEGYDSDHRALAAQVTQLLRVGLGAGADDKRPPDKTTTRARTRRA